VQSAVQKSMAAEINFFLSNERTGSRFLMISCLHVVVVSCFLFVFLHMLFTVKIHFILT
jgi:hypothetical protein